MCCNRSINRSGECGQVMGTSGSQTIALRGPGCISGTGRCEGVAGTGGGCGCCCCCGCGCGNVGGTGGSGCGNVGGTGGFRRCWDVCDWCLGTPTIVPR